MSIYNRCDMITMSVTQINKSLENLKICAGKNCPNTGIKILKIKYLHKTGWFCENCTKKLSKEELIEPENVL